MNSLGWNNFSYDSFCSFLYYIITISNKTAKLRSHRDNGIISIDNDSTSQCFFFVRLTVKVNIKDANAICCLAKSRISICVVWCVLGLFYFNGKMKFGSTKLNRRMSRQVCLNWRHKNIFSSSNTHTHTHTEHFAWIKKSRIMNANAIFNISQRRIKYFINMNRLTRVRSCVCVWKVACSAHMPSARCINK